MEQQRKQSAWSHSSPPEWIAAFVSGVLVLLILGYTLYEGVTRRSRPPLISVRADSVVPTPGGFLVMFTARNGGDQTAMGLEIRGTLLRGGATLEESDASIDFVPLDAERQGGLLFANDPRRDSLELRAVGFDTP